MTGSRPTTPCISNAHRWTLLTPRATLLCTRRAPSARLTASACLFRLARRSTCPTAYSPTSLRWQHTDSHTQMGSVGLVSNARLAAQGRSPNKHVGTHVSVDTAQLGCHAAALPYTRGAVADSKPSALAPGPTLRVPRPWTARAWRGATRASSSRVVVVVAVLWR